MGIEVGVPVGISVGGMFVAVGGIAVGGISVGWSVGGISVGGTGSRTTSLITFSA
jgi:hypothetical protein